MVDVQRYSDTWFEVTIAEDYGPSVLPAMQNAGGGDVLIRLATVDSKGNPDALRVLVTRDMAQEFVEAWPALLAALEADRA